MEWLPRNIFPPTLFPKTVRRWAARCSTLANTSCWNKLGEGGMGVVFKAQHRRMKRLVAVKMIAKKEIGSPDAVKRFYREVEAAAKLEPSQHRAPPTTPASTRACITW